MAPEQQREPEGAEGPGAGPGITALSLPGRVVVAIAVAVVMVTVAVHLAMVFLHVAPENTVTRQHGEAVDDYVYPEFEQNWKLFAPNPLQQNIAVQARALIARPDGNTATTGWTDLSARDGAGIRHSLAPSHTQQNELRRGWEFFSTTHDSKGRPVGDRGELSQQYIKRIVLWRLGTEIDGGTVERVQVRSAVTPVPPPPFSDGNEKTDRRTEYRAQPWWQVSSADMPGGGSK